MKQPKEILANYQRACDTASNFVEKFARKILIDNKNAHEFVMGMGCLTFWDKNENQIELKDLIGGEALEDFISKWDDTLKITGEPMRFTANGKKITNW